MTNYAIQRQRILRVLQVAEGKWVSLIDIMRPPDGFGAIGQYNARIWDLRHKGYKIENMIQHIDGVRHSWYRLITEGQQTLSL